MRRIEQHHELVDLKEGPCGLWNLDLEVGVAGGIVVPNFVLDCLGEYLAEQAHHHLDRAR
ncbi:MAG TPA: hypothetical protein VK691_09825 [Solirubrobacteraceae bacterium]|nr:hypothetical protein [Solirubrobacteraceae bacterium]